jgi:hypothetical protein
MLKHRLHGAILIALLSFVVVYAAEVVSELCEGTGTPSGWTETSGGGTIDWDEASVVGEGSQSLEIVSAGTLDNVHDDFTGISTAYVHFMWRYASLTSTTYAASLRATTSLRLGLSVLTNGDLIVEHGSATATTVDLVPADTWVHIWLKYVQGTGTDGVAELAWSLDTTRPTSGDKFISLSNGTATTTVDRLRIGVSANETQTVYYDQMIVDDSAYPDPAGGGEPPTRRGQRMLLGVGR